MKKIVIYIAAVFFLTGCKGVAYYYNQSKNKFEFDKKTEASNKKPQLKLKARSPIVLPQDFIWGINGHTIDTPSYTANGSLDLQMQLLNELQLTHYRTNVTLDIEGEVNYWEGDIKRWQETLLKSKKAAVKIFPVILLRNFDFKQSTVDAFETAKKQTAGFAKKYGNQLDHYALGNEMDLYIDFDGKDGSKIEHYDLKKFDVWIAFLKGMAAGIRQEDPTAKLVINGAGRHRYGYFEYIKQQQVDYDIIGFHWYSEMGKVATPYLSEKDGLDIMQYMHEQYKKPIWITEINQHWGVDDHPETHQAFWVDHFIDHLKGREYIKAFMFYELFDRPHLDDGEGYENPRQAYFGLIDWVTPYTSYRYRPAAITYKYKIEEAQRGIQHYTKAVTGALNLDINTSKTVAQMLSTNQNPVEVVAFALQKVENNPLQNQDVERLYSTLLKRKPTTKEIKYWNKELKKQINNQEMIKALLTSTEFYKNSIVNGYEARMNYQFNRQGIFKLSPTLN